MSDGANSKELSDPCSFKGWKVKQRRTIRAPVARNPSCFKIKDSNHEDHYLYFHPVGRCADVCPCRVSAISCPVSAKRKADRSNKHGYETGSGHSCGSRARRYGVCPGPVRKIVGIQWTAAPPERECYEGVKAHDSEGPI